MKKLLSLLGAILLFGIYAANAITVNFNFSTTNGSNPANYVTVFEFDGNNYDVVGIPSTNTISFTYDDNLFLNLQVADGVESDITISGPLGGDPFTVDAFNGFNVGSITYYDGVWDIYLENDYALNGYNFNVTLNTGDSGNTGGDQEPVHANLIFDSYDNELIENYENYLYSFVEVTSTGDVEDLEVESNYTQFSFTPTATISLQPVEGYTIDTINVLDAMMEDLMDSGNVTVAQSDGTWTLTLKEGLPDGFYIMVIISQADNQNPPVEGGDKSVTLNVVNGDYSLVTGMVGYTAQFDNAAYINFNSNSVSYTYSDYLGMYIYSGDNDLDLIVSCATPGLTAGEDYVLYEDDGVWVITLGSDTPDDIAFNISFPGLSSNEKTVTLNLNGVDSESISGFVWTNEEMSDADYLSFTGNTASYQYTNYLGMNIYSRDTDVDLIVTCATPGLNEGVDYELEEDDGAWFITLNSATPESIEFTVAPSVATAVTIEFAGAKYQDGMVEVTTNTFEELDVVNGTVVYDYTDKAYLNFEIVGANAQEYALTFYCEDAQEGNDTYEVSYFGGIYSLALYPGMYGKTIIVTVDVPSAVNSIINDENTEIFNLQGVRLNKNSKLDKGVYIIKGKKVMVK